MKHHGTVNPTTNNFVKFFTLKLLMITFCVCMLKNTCIDDPSKSFQINSKV
jgi:hypothetical protein